MPNWCSNTITIQGPTETIKQLWDDAHVGDDFGLLNAMVPMPKELEGTTAPSDGMNWYGWRTSNWGTKWDVDDTGLEYVDNGDGTSHITGWFDSAWAPPVTAYDTFLDDMDNCSIEATYHEPGMDFVGEYIDGDDNFYDGVTELVEGGAMADDETLARLVEDYAIEEDMEQWAEENA
jgi:hypothetical protein